MKPGFACLAAWFMASTAAVAGDPGRMRPPEAVACDRNLLTSYAGEVTELRREPGVDRIVIATDWGTAEEVTVFHATPYESGLPYLVAGEPLQAGDWQFIERGPDLVKPGIRATAWICDDPAHAVVVDWQLPVRSR